MSVQGFQHQALPSSGDGISSGCHRCHSDGCDSQQFQTQLLLPHRAQDTAESTRSIAIITHPRQEPGEISKKIKVQSNKLKLLQPVEHTTASAPLQEVSVSPGWTSDFITFSLPKCR